MGSGDCGGSERAGVGGGGRRSFGPGDMWLGRGPVVEPSAQLPMAKAIEMRAEHDQSGEQRLHAPIVEAQGGSALTVTLNWAYDLLVGSLANEAVVSDGLDVEETSIGLKADLPQRGEVLESFADPEVT